MVKTLSRIIWWEKLLVKTLSTMKFTIRILKIEYLVRYSGIVNVRFPPPFDNVKSEDCYCLFVIVYAFILFYCTAAYANIIPAQVGGSAA